MTTIRAVHTDKGQCQGCWEVRALEPVRVRVGGRFSTARYCHECAPMVRAFNERGKA